MSRPPLTITEAENGYIVTNEHYSREISKCHVFNEMPALWTFLADYFSSEEE